MTIRRVLLSAAGICMFASPAFASDASAQGSSQGAILLSDAEMDNVVAGEVVAVLKLHRTGSGKIMAFQHGGPSGLLSGEGPDNKGVVSVPEEILQSTPTLITAIGSVAGAPSDGKGNSFITITVSIP